MIRLIFLWILLGFGMLISKHCYSQKLELIENADSSFELGNFEQLILDCDAAIAEFPDTAVLYYYRGVAKFAFGENKTALEDLETSISLESEFAEPFLARARVHYADGNLEMAYKDIRACLKRDPRMEEAFLLRAEMYLDEEILSEAWADLESARKYFPRDPEIYCLRAEYFLLYGDARQAVKEAGTAIRLAPDDALGYATQANAFQAAGDLANAKSDIDLAIQMEPMQYSLLGTRAMILDAMDDREGALNDLERYISKDSLAWDAYLTRAWLYMTDTNWVSAESDLLVSQKIAPEESSIQDQLGYLYVLKGDFLKAKDVLMPLVEKNPSEAFARANLAYALLQLGDTDAALKEIQHAIKLDDLEPRSFYYRAAIYHQMKKPTKACEDIQKAQDLGFADYYGEREILVLKKKACD